MIFEDRVEAGRKLALALEKYRGQDGIVYGLPRGGVVVAAEIAKALNFPLDILVTKKVGHPEQPEYAICAITEHKFLLCNQEETETLNQKWLKTEIEAKYQEALEKSLIYRGDQKPNSAQGKVAIIVDDGIATGLTIMAAVSDLLSSKPSKLIVAVPVIPQEVVSDLMLLVDEVVALETPSAEEFLGAVGAYYKQFPQVTDQEVTALLKSANQK